MLQCSNNRNMQKIRGTGVMFPFAKPASPNVVWRNPELPQGTRRANYCDTVPEGRTYEVVEKACNGEWVIVTVLTVVDGRANVAAA